MDLQPLEKYLKTTTDVNDLQHLLDQVSDGLYRSDVSAEELISRSLPYEEAIIINKLAASNGIIMNDKASVQGFLQKVRQEVTTLPSIQITLAASPSIVLITRIHDWFYRMYHKSILLDIKVDPKIVAGCIISSKGKYFDYSIGKKADELFAVAEN